MQDIVRDLGEQLKYILFYFLYLNAEQIWLYVHISIQLLPPEVEGNCFHWSNTTVMGVRQTAAASVGINHVLKLYSDVGPWEHIDS